MFHAHELVLSERKSLRETFHTTAAQAATIAKKANVKQLVIGHFSARYEDESVLLEEAQMVFPETILARENLCITIPL